MYSMIMMTAMASTPNAMDFNGYFRDRWNCNGGCCGTTAASFNGCNGCNGHGGLFSGDRIRSLFGFNGSCNGCNGSCNGCSGSYPVSSGCCGAAAMYSCGGGMMEMGSPYATPMPVTYYGGCFGSPGFTPSSPAPMQTIPPTNLPGTPYAQPTPTETGNYTPKNQLPLPGGVASSPNRATVIVKLPADAKLMAEGQTLSLTSAERTFVSPELPPGKEFNYTFRVEYDRAGRTLTESRTVTVMPGKVSNLEFGDLSMKAEPAPKTIPETRNVTATSLAKNDPAMDRARLIVRIPAGATLYVNDAKQITTELVKEFRTPPLPTGKEYTYTMKVETIRNGMPESVSQQVKFRAGDSVNVDLSGTASYDAAVR